MTAHNSALLLQPTSDASSFVNWLTNVKSGPFADLEFAVYGLGHPDWASTYHAVPKLIDEKLHQLGGKRITERGECDTSAIDLYSQLASWTDRIFTKLSGGNVPGDTGSLHVAVASDHRMNLLRHGELGSAIVLSNSIISESGPSMKRHISLKLPDGISYVAGDYLTVLSTGPSQIVRRALARFSLHADDMLTISATGAHHAYPTDTPLCASDLFAGYVEMQTPITVKLLKRLGALATSQTEKSAINRYLEPEAMATEITGKQVTLLHLLEEFPHIDFSLGEFLEALPTMRPRQVRTVLHPVPSAPAHGYIFSTRSHRHR